MWWENMAMIKLIDENQSDKNKIQTTDQHKRFNAYITGLPGQPLWQPGDFLVHFAGVYKCEKMQMLIERIQAGEIPRLDRRIRGDDGSSVLTWLDPAVCGARPNQSEEVR